MALFQIVAVKYYTIKVSCPLFFVPWCVLNGLNAFLPLLLLALLFTFEGVSTICNMLTQQIVALKIPPRATRRDFKNHPVLHDL